MTEIRLYDTMAREKRVFTPADPERITMYLCGPTVYGRAHIGNARPAVVFDVLARLLRHVHPERRLDFARNVTDVDDKIIEASRAEGVAPSVITERYERFYDEDMGALGVEKPVLTPHATEHIPQMIAMIARLIARGNAYEADGHVLFNVPSDPDYGALGRRDRDAMIAGARVEVASYKKDPADFVLWKPSPEGVIGWDSPWGKGRPGWHIECSAMIAAHLGETIDIHGGGLDLIFPHHENELAQSRCAHEGAPLARYWVHNGFLSMAGSDKMSKSLGNVVTPAELLGAGHKGEVLRLALLSAHYRQPLEWSDALVESKAAQIRSWYRAKKILLKVRDARPDVRVVRALGDDLNTPLAVSLIDDLARQALETRDRYLAAAKIGDGPLADSLRKKAGRLARKMLASARMMGLLREPANAWLSGVGLSKKANWKRGTLTKSIIESRMAARAEAKRLRDFSEADRIRAELAEEGVLLEDGPNGTTWRRA